MPTEFTDPTSNNPLGENLIKGSSISLETDFKKDYKDWVILFFVGLAALGPMFALEASSVVELQLLGEFGLSQGTWNMLTAVKALFTVPMPLLGGMFIDYVGYRKVLVFAQFIIVISQALTAWAVQIDSLGLLVFGGFLGGLLMDASIIATTTFVSKLFYHKELAIAAGFVGIFQKSAPLISNLLLPDVYEEYSLTTCFTVSTLITAGSFSSALVAAYLDHKREKAKLINYDASNSHKMSLRDLKKVPKIIWILSVATGCSLMSYIFLYSNLNAILQDKFGLTVTTAGEAVTILTPTSFTITITAGVLLNIYGNRPKLIILNTLFFVLACLIFQILPPCTECYTFILPLIILGCFSGSSIIILSSSLPFLIDMKRMGLGFGAATLIMNLLAIPIPLSLGTLLDLEEGSNGYQGYTGVFWFFIAVGIVGFIFSIILYKHDKKIGGPLSQVRPNNDLLPRMRGPSVNY